MKTIQEIKKYLEKELKIDADLNENFYETVELLELELSDGFSIEYDVLTGTRSPHVLRGSHLTCSSISYFVKLCQTNLETDDVEELDVLHIHFCFAFDDKNEFRIYVD